MSPKEYKNIKHKAKNVLNTCEVKIPFILFFK